MATVKTKDDASRVGLPLKPETKAALDALNKPKAKGKNPVAVDKHHMGDVTVRQESDSPLALLQTVERLATNKNTNPAIVEMLLAEMRSLRAERSKREFDAAMSAMQGRLPIIDRKGRIEVRKKDSSGERTGAVQQSTPYALYEDIIERVLPILSAHGFSISHVSDTEEKVRVVSTLSGYGHDRTTKLTLMHDSTGSKNSVQAVVSSISYAKRINLCALLSLATRGEDDDGASTGGALVVDAALSAEQRTQVVEMATAVQCPGPHLLKHLNKKRPDGHPEAESIDDLPASRFDEAIAALRSYEANKKARATKEPAQ